MLFLSCIFYMWKVNFAKLVPLGKILFFVPMVFFSIGILTVVPINFFIDIPIILWKLFSKDEGIESAKEYIKYYWR